MDPTQAIHAIDATLRKLGFSYAGPGACDYDGVISVSGLKLDIHLSVSDTTFLQLPTATLKNPQQVPPGRMGHVIVDNSICYASEHGLLLDMYKPGESILRVVDEIHRTLDVSEVKVSQSVAEEFQLYWKSQKRVRFMLPSQHMVGPLKAFKFFAENYDGYQFEVISSKNKLKGHRVFDVSKVLVWFLPEIIGTGGNIRCPRDLEEFKLWLMSQNLPSNCKWKDVLFFLNNGRSFFVSAPNAVVGCSLKSALKGKMRSFTGNHAVRSTGKLTSRKFRNVEIDRLSGILTSFQDVTSRNNLLSNCLMDVSVALIGCGTIGGFLSRMLVQSGFGLGNGVLTIVDKGILEPGNIGRHFLGFDYLGQRKVTALKKELERFHPDVKIKAINADVKDVWNDLRKHQLIIDVTGEWNVQCALNDRFLNDQTGKVQAVLHAWVVMNGASVQSFLNLDDDFACFRCLRPEMGEDWRYPGAKKDVQLELQPATCGDDPYAAFSVDCSVMSASLAARSALDWATGKPGKRLRTIVIDDDRGRFHRNLSPVPSKRCPACARLRERH
ncbi:ThiF family adenylyltransferase [Thalassospira lucentensis]|uniref:ThiF family adenylyltransferase n=1 Tax=Thalassospira lucentensis TaxID=168935 RepID=UPI002942A152|nr:ThiF family adenylyltransferase [Thalassospira lucentensis]WOI09831.1 ThiF family adenylyltransferase [Thalassospira lucentensis]